MFEASNIGKKEEITDILTPEGVRSGDFDKGSLLKFRHEDKVVTMKITKIDRKAGRAWAEHVSTMPSEIGLSHYGHLVDNTETTRVEFGAPYCQDCDSPINERSTLEGNAKANKRREETLEDGTIIE